MSRRRGRTAAPAARASRSDDESTVGDPLPRRAASWLLAVLLAATGFVYAPSFRIPFLLDDYRTIRHNPLVHEWSGLPALWQSDPARFVGMATFVANYRLGNFDVFGYHVANLLIHCLATCAVCGLGHALLRCSRSDAAKITCPAGTFSGPMV